jgi:hypothetical protein
MTKVPLTAALVATLFIALSASAVDPGRGVGGAGPGGSPGSGRGCTGLVSAPAYRALA